jgi:hypothetical protein
MPNSQRADPTSFLVIDAILSILKWFCSANHKPRLNLGGAAGGEACR